MTLPFNQIIKRLKITYFRSLDLSSAIAVYIAFSLARSCKSKKHGHSNCRQATHDYHYSENLDKCETILLFNLHHL